jgi:hypothetical protein
MARELVMTDLLFLGVSIAFFIGSIVYSLGCQSLKGGRDDA